MELNISPFSNKQLEKNAILKAIYVAILGWATVA